MSDEATPVPVDEAGGSVHIGGSSSHACLGLPEGGDVASSLHITSLRDGLHNERSEGGDSSARAPGGPSVKSLARALAEAMWPRLYLWHFTLTSKTGLRPEMEGRVRELLALVAARDQRIGMLGALDVSRKGRYHLHVVVQLPDDRRPDEILRWWRKLWPRGLRPGCTNGAQDARLILDQRQLEITLRHDLRAAGRVDSSLRGRVSLVGPLCTRVAACGDLQAIWLTVAAKRHVPGVVVPKRHRRRKRSVTLVRPQSLLKTTNGACGWCGKAMEAPRRRFHPSCRKGASRVLRAAEKAHGAAVRALVEQLESAGWLRREALREAIATVNLPTSPLDWMGRGVAGVPRRCSCGRRVAARITAKTCGRSTCRTRARRRGDHEALLDRAQASGGHLGASVGILRELDRPFAIRLARRSLGLRQELGARSPAWTKRNRYKFGRWLQELRTRPGTAQELAKRASVRVSVLRLADFVSTAILDGHAVLTTPFNLPTLVAVGTFRSVPKF